MIKKYDIYWYDWGYEEDLLTPDGKSKVRPVLIINTDGFHPVVQKISSKKHDGYIELKDWRNDGLKKLCYLTPTKRFVHEKALGDYIGHLTDKEIQNLKSKRMLESYLTEISRTQYQQRSKGSDKYAPGNQSNGRNRFERRLVQKVDKSIKEMNRINMNKFFTQDILDVNVIVHGETDDYVVTVEFADALSNIQQELQRNNQEISLRIILRGLIKAFNGENIFTRCTCPDYRYRIAYYASKEGAIAGEPEDRPSDMTNPFNTKGLSCKHVQAVLNRNTWLNRVASVIYNYIRYMENHYQQLYAEIIYPALYGKEYEEPYQTDIINNKELDSTQDEIDTANKWARERTQWKQGNEYRFRPSDDIKGQKEFNFDSIDEEPSEAEEVPQT